MKNLVQRIEDYIQDFVTLADPHYSLPLALWTIGTFCFPDFDAFPYLVITSPTKRSGKTRLSEMLTFACSNPRNFGAVSASIYRLIETERPTIVFDEAETLSSEAASTMRAVLNVGYRRGQTIPRTVGQTIKEFQTYCPKIFVLIGDVYDTLRDRSIIITMKRAETRRRFTYDVAKAEGQELREAIHAAVSAHAGDIQHGFQNHKGLPFLMDRDEEIWTSLFVLAEIFCKSRMQELEIAAVDMSTEKTQESKRYVDLRAAEDKATEDEYAKRLISDLYGLFAANGRAVIRTEDVIDLLKAIPTAPWRKFRGEGIDAHDLSNMLSRFGLRPVRVQYGNGRENRKQYRGYKRKDVEKALTSL